MAFVIKDTKLNVAETDIFNDEAGYAAFPTAESVTFDREKLIPIGLLSFNMFDAGVDDKTLIALPNLQGIPDGDYGPITYSYIDEQQGWCLDDEYANDDTLEEQDEYLDNYQQAQDEFAANQCLMRRGKKLPLITLGGQPRFGQNWASCLYNELAKNPELDHYYEVTCSLNHPEFEHMSTRDIVYVDEKDNKEYTFIGSFKDEAYLVRDSEYLGFAGEFMVFYQPQLKKVMLVAEYD
ncbi:hypothetical protein ACRZ5S_04720 [Vibrio scophthalmi]|uniref:hypothetical protein n=1 Tax=Vibrio scophthalmi TaxID=45658 RepID=UPI002284E29D|nr:hypothetical protein [Vibrio scophthalmi]MCY9801840.1 hypothetical protein [Vibrio scophthalmi]